MFIKVIFKNSKKVKRIKNYISKCNLYQYFQVYQNLLISGEKMLMSAELGGCVRWFIYFLDLLWVSYNCEKFHHCKICVTCFREEGAFLVSPSVSNHEKVHMLKLFEWEKKTRTIAKQTKIQYLGCKVRKSLGALDPQPSLPLF